MNECWKCHRKEPTSTHGLRNLSWWKDYVSGKLERPSHE